MNEKITLTEKTFDLLTARELHDILQLRNKVFIVEQNAAYLDVDGRDLAARHLLLRDGSERLLAYCRLLPPGLSYPEAAIGRVVVDPEARGQGLAHELLNEAIPRCLTTYNVSRIHISAQKYLQDFYAGHGFQPCTEDYLEDGIPHVGMDYDHAAEAQPHAVGPIRVESRYLGHSAWLVTTPTRILLFDYGDRPTRHLTGALNDGILNLDELPDLPLYAFASHRHGDHYSARLHSILAQRARTIFVLGLDEQPSCSETELSPVGTVLAWPHSVLEIEDMTVSCSGSTDSGVSFLIETPEALIYHGGDLALWDNTTFFNRVYREEIEWLTGRVNPDRRPDLAFLPVCTSDGYQEEALLSGLWLFIEKIAPIYVLTMHGHGFEELYKAFAETAAARGIPNILTPMRRGEVFEIDLHHDS